MPARRYRAAAGLAALLTLSALSAARAGDWGTIKGKVILDGDIPKPTEIKVDADPKECLKNGPLFSQEYVVDKNTKGVRWVVVWLMPADFDSKNLKAQFKKINPDAEPKDKEVVIDQPCCQFEPRVLVIRAGKQKLVINNPAPMPHNTKIDGGPKNIDLNQLVAPNSKYAVDWDWQPTPSGAVPFSCTVHKWMKGYIRVIDHPYYAVTNEKGEFEIKGAPAGKCRIIVWHETGWVVGDKEPSKYGVPITVVADKTTEVEYKLKPEGK
jgi:hypothetical protein